MKYPRQVDWISKRCPAESLDFVRAVSSWLAKAGGPLTESLNKLLQEGDYRAVVDFQIDYTEDFTLDDFRYARQVQALLSKQTWLDLGYQPELKGVEAFMKAEERCRLTNLRLDSSRPNGRVSVVSYYAICKIDEILGQVPKLEELTFLYGPGASTNVKSAEASAIAKLSASLVCSEDCLPHVGELLAEFPYLTIHHGYCDLEKSLSIQIEGADDWVMEVPVSVGCGKLVFVAKSAKTTRPIVVEPILNGLAQKGIGSYLKSRMLSVSNLDLSDQQRNRRSAYQGSVDGSLATIDLASASDTLSIGTVAELLPPQWFDFLGRFRTGEVTHAGQIMELEKFSSMGNGYTFELESLIFYSLAVGVCRCLDLNKGAVSVFGDDIIVPTEAYELLRETLEYYGFEVNTEKSYHCGPFRESCGADWLRGSDIRPFYLRDQISEQTLYSFHNWAMRNCERELAALILEWTLEPLRLFGPDGYGDGHLIGSHRLRSNRKIQRRLYEGGFFDTYMLRPRRLKKRRPGDWLYPSYSTYARGGVEDPLKHLGFETQVDSDVVRGSSGYVKISIYTLARAIFNKP
jgi:hypothetical protein